MIFYFPEPGVDFILPTPSSVEFPASANGSNTQCIEVAIVDDLDYEGDQMFNTSFLLETTLPVIISNRITEVTIIDNGG